MEIHYLCYTLSHLKPWKLIFDKSFKQLTVNIYDKAGVELYQAQFKLQTWYKQSSVKVSWQPTSKLVVTLYFKSKEEVYSTSPNNKTFWTIHFTTIFAIFGKAQHVLLNQNKHSAGVGEEMLLGCVADISVEHFPSCQWMDNDQVLMQADTWSEDIISVSITFALYYF